MKLNTQSEKIKKDLLKIYEDLPLVDVLADSIMRYDNCQQIINADGLSVNGKPHGLLTTLRSLAQTITGCTKELKPKVEAVVVEDTIKKLKDMRPLSRIA